MQVQTFRLGPYQTNCHLLHDGKRVWIIDPGFDGLTIGAHIRAQGWEAQAVILTHSHWDHLLGIPGLRETYPNIAIHVHAADARYLGSAGSRALRDLAISLDPGQKLIPMGLWESLPEATDLLADHDVIDGCGLTVLHTPGHTPGSVSFYLEREDLLFSGDTLFAGTIGRTDLPGSDPEAIMRSIRETLLKLPEQTTVYPGHGPATTIGREKRNPWL